MTIVLRNKKWHLKKDVPRRYASIEPRKVVCVSLHTDSKEKADLQGALVWQEMLAAWDARLDGDTDDAEQRFAAAKRLAAKRGFSYLPVSKVAELSREERLQRVEKIPLQNNGPNRIEAQALLGVVAEPEVTIEKALEVFWLHEADKELGKSDDQIRRWRNPKMKAVKNLVSQVGNKEISAIMGDLLGDLDCEAKPVRDGIGPARKGRFLVPTVEGRVDFDPIEHRSVSGQAISLLRKPVGHFFRDGPGGGGDDGQSSSPLTNMGAKQMRGRASSSLIDDIRNKQEAQNVCRTNSEDHYE